jgi:site-specific DNA-methyltransferase (adenine-specific)
MARPNGAIESPGWGYHGREQDWSSNAGGRFPSNLLLDDAAAAWLDAQSGHSVSSDRVRHNHQSLHSGQGIYGVYGDQNTGGYADEGGASRFFARVGWGEDDIPFRYCTKASKAERHAGCQHLLDRMPDTANDDEDDAGATTAKIGPWPCVKPLAVMRWLVRLTTPPGGTLIDPYAGSGTTLIAALQEKLSCDGIELDDEAALIAHARLAHWSQDHSVAQLTLF